MFCDNDECCNCQKEVPMIAFGASDISEGYSLTKCQGRQKDSVIESKKFDLRSPENIM
jgi:hypothetical protein